MTSGHAGTTLASPDRPSELEIELRTWLAFVFGGVLVGLAYAADVLVARMFAVGRASFSFSSALTIEAIARIALVALVLALAWIVLHGPRSRLVGSAMVVIGGYIALIVPLSPAVLVNSEIPLPPLAIELLGQTTDFTSWVAAAVLLLGVVEILRPTPVAHRAQAATDLSVARP